MECEERIVEQLRRLKFAPPSEELKKRVLAAASEEMRRIVELEDERAMRELRKGFSWLLASAALFAALLLAGDSLLSSLFSPGESGQAKPESVEIFALDQSGEIVKKVCFVAPGTANGVNVKELVLRREIAAKAAL